GKFGEACAIGEQALAAGGDAAALNAMLGMLRSQAGDLQAAANHLRAAQRSRPGDLVIGGNLAAVLAQLGDYRGALEIATEEVAKADRSGRLLKTRAFAAQMLEDHPTAISSYEMLVALDPGDWESWNNLGNSRREQGDAVGSIAALRRAIEIEPRSPPVWLNLATALVAGAHFEDAEQQLRKMAEDFPADEKPLRELHALYQQQMRDEEALEAIEGAVKRAPDKVDLWLALASH